jgi:predicted peptidase
MALSKWVTVLATCALAAAGCALPGGQDQSAGGVKVVSYPTASAPVNLSEYEALVYTDKDGKTLSYRLLKPAQYDPKTKYPLVLFLHGAGERGNDNARQLDTGGQVLGTEPMRAKFPCFEVVPQCPADLSWGGGRPTSQPVALAEPLRLALEIVAKTRKDYSIDENRLYITGLSMGGFGTWEAITRYPDMFAAAAPVAGGGDPARVKAIADAKLPIWLWHGANDTIVDPERSREMVRALKAAGWQAKYTETPGQGHFEHDRAYYGDELWVWMFAQKKAKP